MVPPGEDITRRLLTEAGLRPGMRVLDLGCGGGDVSLLAAEIVGAGGSVLGIDRETAAIERAAARAPANVEFRVLDLADLSSGFGSFDAVVMRRVLMYQPDAIAMLRRAREVAASGGLLILQEHDATGMPLVHPDWPLHRQVHTWMWATVAAEGANVRMGLELAPTMEAAGWSVGRVRAETTVLTRHQSHPIAGIMAAMRPRVLAHGIASEDEVAFDTLEARLDEERRMLGGTCIWETVFCAWARNRS